MKKRAKKNTIIYQSAFAPIYDPSDWEDGDALFNNNCCSYTCDIKEVYAQPGLAAGEIYKKINCHELSKAAVADGLTPIKYNSECPHKSHKAALAIWTDKTFHWYRLDCNDLWSDKPEYDPRTNLDYSGNSIIDPRKADRGPFSIFCGFFCVCKENIRIT